MTNTPDPTTTAPHGRLAAARAHYEALAGEAATELLGPVYGPPEPLVLHAWEWRGFYADLRDAGTPPA